MHHLLAGWKPQILTEFAKIWDPSQRTVTGDSIGQNSGSGTSQHIPPNPLSYVEPRRHLWTLVAEFHGAGGAQSDPDLARAQGQFCPQPTAKKGPKLNDNFDTNGLNTIPIPHPLVHYSAVFAGFFRVKGLWKTLVGLCVSPCQCTPR